MRSRVVVGVLCIWLVAGCSPSGPGDQASIEQQVTERAEGRWQALVEGDFRQAYEFESPAYRSLTPYERFRAQFGDAAVWHGAEVTKVTVGEAGDVADLVLSLDYTAITPSGESYKGRRGIKEKWLMSSGDWWIVRE